MNKILILIIVLIILTVDLQAQAFNKASVGYKWNFPKDHGSHPEFETEWWYITGQLVGPNQDIFDHPAKYGFQITFFRRSNREAGNKVSQSFLAHAAISDLENKKFYSSQRIADELLASASEQELKISNNEWFLEGDAQNLKSEIILSYSPLIKLTLSMTPSQELLKHGQNGYSKKSSCADCASMYYSIPRLQVNSDLEIDGQKHSLSGLAWYDHEFFTNILDKQQIGWDWFNLMFKDGSNLMAFAIRTKDNPKSFVSGTFQKDKLIQNLSREQIDWSNINYSKLKSGSTYPTKWLLKSEILKEPLTIQAIFEEQEIVSKSDNLPSYWEGAVSARQAIGYFEMTGYDRDLKKGF